MENKAEVFLKAGIFALLILVAFNAFSTFGVGSLITKEIEEAKELAKPAELEMVVIQTTCLECFNIEPFVQGLKGDTSIKLVKEETIEADSELAKTLIAKYRLTRLPAIILNGQVEKASLDGFQKHDDALVFANVQAPYVDAASLEVKGLVAAIILEDSACEKCSKLEPLLDNLKANKIVFSSEKTLDYQTEEGKQAAEKYGVKQLPVLLLSIDALEYASLAQGLGQMQPKEGFYVVDGGMPRYDIEKKKVVGLVHLTMLGDNSCADCYDVNVHKQVLQRFGVVLEDEKLLDISSAEGKALVEKYKILSAPTVILTGDQAEYPTLAKVWTQVGSIEADGSYVFRELSALGPNMVYMDLASGAKTTTEALQQ